MRLRLRAMWGSASGYLYIVVVDVPDIVRVFPHSGSCGFCACEISYTS